MTEEQGKKIIELLTVIHKELEHINSRINDIESNTSSISSETNLLDYHLRDIITAIKDE